MAYLKALNESGFINSELKRLRDELTFNNLLNIVLPLSLGKLTCGVFSLLLMPLIDCAASETI